MPKRKRAVVQPTIAALDQWKQLLAKRPKGELIDFIVESARTNSGYRGMVESRFDLANSPEELVESTRRAIDAATDFDERELNSNYDYDSASYQLIKKNFTALAKAGKYAELRMLSLELMRDGSYQVECSDEGLMTGDIEECLRVVIGALKKSDLTGSSLNVWSEQMLKADRVGFICQEELCAFKEAVSAR